MLTQINQWWFSLEARERTLLKLLSAFLILVLGYLLVWSPIQQSKLSAQQSLSAAQQEWQWLNQQLPLVQERRASGSVQQTVKVTNQNQLLGLLQSSLRQQNLFKEIKTVKGISKGGEVSFEAVKASRLFRWLGVLEQQGVMADRLQVTWLAPDQVKASMQFKVD